MQHQLAAGAISTAIHADVNFLQCDNRSRITLVEGTLGLYTRYDGHVERHLHHHPPGRQFPATTPQFSAVFVCDTNKAHPQKVMIKILWLSKLMIIVRGLESIWPVNAGRISVNNLNHRFLHRHSSARVSSDIR